MALTQPCCARGFPGTRYELSPAGKKLPCRRLDFSATHYKLAAARKKLPCRGRDFPAGGGRFSGFFNLRYPFRRHLPGQKSLYCEAVGVFQDFLILDTPDFRETGVSRFKKKRKTPGHIQKGRKTDVFQPCQGYRNCEILKKRPPARKRDHRFQKNLKTEERQRTIPCLSEKRTRRTVPVAPRTRRTVPLAPSP